MGLSQTEFAALAGAQKGTQISWEKDASSPNASALVAFADAGADVLYILTGRRTMERPDNAVTQIEDQLASIRRHLLDPSRLRLPEDTDDQRAEQRALSEAGAIHAMLRHDAAFLTSELREQAESLLAISADPAKLAAFRAADYAQRRAKRRETKDYLTSYLDGGPYEPGDAVINILATLAMDYAVPIKLAVELVEEIHEDITARSASGKA